MNKTNKRILIMSMFSILMILLVSYYPTFLIPVLIISMVFFSVLIIIRWTAGWKERKEELNSEVEIFNHIFPKRYSKQGRIFYFIVFFFIMFLMEPAIKYMVPDFGFLTEKFEKEVIIKKINSTGQLIDQTTYNEYSFRLKYIILLLFFAIVFLIASLRQEMDDDERMKTIRYKAYREAFIVAVLFGILLILINWLYYLPSWLLLVYVILIVVIYQFRSRLWADKI